MSQANCHLQIVTRHSKSVTRSSSLTNIHLQIVTRRLSPKSRHLQIVTHILSLANCHTQIVTQKSSISNSHSHLVTHILSLANCHSLIVTRKSSLGDRHASHLFSEEKRNPFFLFMPPAIWRMTRLRPWQKRHTRTRKPRLITAHAWRARTHATWHTLWNTRAYPNS